MEKVRIGNDIEVKYTVLRDGQPESFDGATNIVVEVKNEAYGKVIPSTFSIVDNVVNVVLDAKDCVLCGKHRVTLSYNRGNNITIDALAFELVQFTSLTGGTEIVGVEIVPVNISGDIGIAIPDNSKADLVGGKIPTSQLPSYVVNVLEYTNLAAFPATGETGKIYVALDTNLTYRWSGTAYVEISKSLALGETSDTAYRGDRGKTAYDHSQATGNVHGTTASQIPNTPSGTIAATTVQGAINELASDIVQVETDLNQTDIKNAEQDASIRSIEQLLSQSNLNQTAQVSSSGREIVSLPKTASNGGMEVKLEGLTAQNLVVNGDFRNGTTGWRYQKLVSPFTVVSGEAIYTPSVKFGGIIRDIPYFSVGDIMYSAAYVKTTDLKTYMFFAGTSSTKYHSGSGLYEKLSDRNTVSINTNLYSSIATSSTTEFSETRVKYLLTINLTASFGAGNEPDLATCDAIFSTYFEGTKSFIPTGRIRVADKLGKNVSRLYLTSSELKSNKLVKDEIRKGANGYELVQRINPVDGTILAAPVITPIDHAGVLNSAESGTVYHEPVVADAGVYSSNLKVLNTTYSISSIEEIIVHTAVDTYLDVSKAVIASDGLSFTHPDLRAGDLVLFTYFFNKEKVNGLITATYYDGRYVIADTANGKFYKWGVKSTNGVATIQLTEV